VGAVSPQTRQWSSRPLISLEWSRAVTNHDVGSPASWSPGRNHAVTSQGA